MRPVDILSNPGMENTARIVAVNIAVMKKNRKIFLLLYEAQRRRKEKV